MKRTAPALDQSTAAAFEAGPLTGFTGPVVCAGSGRMGRSMAIAFAYAGMPVTLLDLKSRDDAGLAAQQAQAIAEIDRHLASLRRAGLIGDSDIGRIGARIGFAGAARATEVLADARLVLEGVPERLDDKRAAFALIEAAAPHACVIASTTSSFLAGELAAMFRRPERFLNAHWLNPAYLIPVVEVSAHDGTDPAVTEALCAVLAGIGKVPIRCRPSPGYIVPRLQALVMNEAARLVEEGVASAAEVDRAVRLGFGMRYASMGVLEFVDYGGVDILHYASGYMAAKVDAQRYRSPDLVATLMADGDIGLRSGQGFYDWQAIDADEYRDRLLARMAGWLRSENLLAPPADD
ncbi:MAG: 3-hydroxyacyl-CoA dehydrogenase NAD-binding domain-containing protein [Burkholderiaceae bacterium]